MAESIKTWTLFPLPIYPLIKVFKSKLTNKTFFSVYFSSMTSLEFVKLKLLTVVSRYPTVFLIPVSDWEQADINGDQLMLVYVQSKSNTYHTRHSLTPEFQFIWKQILLTKWSKCGLFNLTYYSVFSPWIEDRRTGPSYNNPGHKVPKCPTSLLICLFLKS